MKPDLDSTTMARCGCMTPTRGRSRSCRSRPARSGCTSAARRSTRGPTSETRGRSSSACGFAAGSPSAGTTRRSSTTSRTSTTRSTTPRRVRAPSSPCARRSGTSRTHRTSVSACPTSSRRRRELVPQIVAAIEQLVERGYAYEVDGDVYYRVSRFAEYGKLSGQRPEQVEEQEPNARKEDPRDFALWKANKPGEDTSWESPWGRGRPGWHIECSVMAEELLGPVLRDPRRRTRPRLPAPRERDCPVACARASVREAVGAQRDAPLHRREDVEVRGQRHDDARRARPVGARDAARLLPDRALVEADRLLGRDADGGGGSRRRACARCFAIPPSRLPKASGNGSRPPSTTTSTRPRRSSIMHSWRDHELLRRALDVFGLASLAESEEAPAEVRELAEQRLEARANGDFAEGDRLRCARSTPPAGSCGTSQAVSSSFRSVDARPGLRAARRARGAAGPAAGARALGDRARARGRAVARRVAGEGAGQARARALGRRRHARPPGRGRVDRAVPVRRRVGARAPRNGRFSSASTASPIRATSAPSAAAPRARPRRESSCRPTDRRR